MNLSTQLSGLIQSSALVFGLWLLLRLVPRVSANTRGWLWRLAILKLAFSAIALGTITLHVMPGNGAPAPKPFELQTTSAAVNLPPVDQQQIEASELPVAIGPARATFGRPSKVTGRIFELLGARAWCVGVALLCLRLLVDAIKVRRWLQQAAPITDSQILSCLGDLSDDAGLSRVPRLVASGVPPSPMVYGLWRPLIIIPTGMASAMDEDLRLALAHEVAHIRRRDLAWAVIAWLVRSLLFFNPAAWLAEKELRAAQESATDQEAVWLSGATVSAYGEMLLRAMIPNRVAWNPSGLPMFDSYRNAHRRLQAMKHFSNRPTLVRRALGMALVLVGAGCVPTYTLAPATAASMPHGLGTREVNGKLPLSSPNSLGNPPSINSHAAANSKTSLPGSTSTLAPNPPILIMSVGPSGSGVKSMPLTATPSPSPLESPNKEAPDADAVDSIESEDLKRAAKAAEDEYGARVDKLIEDQAKRIAEYRQGANQREVEAEQREREGQQRKREGEQRARASLLREQVIEMREKDHYKFSEPGQVAEDRRQRGDDERQREADQYQLRLDQKQRETDQWQREFDAKSIATMRDETQRGIATARSEYQKTIRELIADDLSRKREAADAAAYTQDQTRLTHPGAGMHTVRTEYGLSLDIPNGYEVAEVKPNGKATYTVVLTRAKLKPRAG